jgi:membrane-bound serine protease (ClpP class)
LMDPDVPGYGVPLPLIAGVGLFTAALVFATVSLAARARRQPVVSGREDLLGAHGIVVQEGWARVRGELWSVVSAAPLAAGQAVRVTRLDGLTLSVEPITTITKGGPS